MAAGCRQLDTGEVFHHLRENFVLFFGDPGTGKVRSTRSTENEMITLGGGEL